MPMTHTARARRLPCLLLLLLLLLFTSCAGAPEERYFAYADRDFFAVLEGNRNGSDFRCEVISRNGAPAEITYLAPEALHGLHIKLTENDGVQAEQNGISVLLPAGEEMLNGMLTPARLLLPENAEILAVRKFDDRTELKLAASDTQQIVLTLSPDGIPLTVCTGEMTFRVAEFRTESNG